MGDTGMPETTLGAVDSRVSTFRTMPFSTSSACSRDSPTRAHTHTHTHTHTHAHTHARTHKYGVHGFCTKHMLFFRNASFLAWSLFAVRLAWPATRPHHTTAAPHCSAQLPAQLTHYLVNQQPHRCSTSTNITNNSRKWACTRRDRVSSVARTQLLWGRDRWLRPRRSPTLWAAVLMTSS